MMCGGTKPPAVWDQILGVKDELNSAIERTRRVMGFMDEDLSEFDMYVLSICLEPLKLMPLIAGLMDPDEADVFRNGTDLSHYKFAQKVVVKEVDVDASVREDLVSLYQQWFKYDCIDAASGTQGTVYSVDDKPETK